jgi:DNA-binding NarL/FixJ family response regulator
MTWDATPNSATTESAADVSGRTGSVGVLVVDDSPVFRRGMTHAVGLHAGLELLGDLDGVEALERLRDLDPPPACRVLIVSASLDEETERAARAAGATGCVSKDLARADICATALRVARQ